MKIYIVSATSYSDSILGYFSTKEKAYTYATADDFIWSETLDDPDAERVYLNEPY